MWQTWYIKVIYTFGKPKTIALTVKARTQAEAERKAQVLVQGRCLGFLVTTTP